MASVRQEVRSGVDKRMSKLSVTQAVNESDYTLVANIGEPPWQIQALPVRSVPAEKSDVGQGKKRRGSTVNSENPAKRECGTATQTPKKKIGKMQAPLTPPATPENESTVVVYDMTQFDDVVVEVVCNVVRD